jgi:hypothetical protein
VAITVTLQSLLSGALMKLGALSVGGVMPADEATQNFLWANQMLDSWGLEPYTIPFEKREVFALISGQGSPANPYTIGPGGDFDTVRPEWLKRAGLLQLSVSPHVEIPRDLLTDQAYAAIAIKDLASSYFTGVYYNAEYPLGKINLYPVPNTASNSLVLYSNQPIPGFAALTTDYIFPAGYAQVIEDNLACLLADPYGRSVPPNIARRAGRGLSALKRSNIPPTDLAIDPALTEDARRPWNILSDS